MTPFLLLFVALATASPVRRQLAAIDTDGDHHLSKPEVLAAMSLHDAMVALDTDGDHRFYLQDIVRIFGDESLFHQVNSNGDDHLTFGEIQHGTSLAAIFDILDRNGDGYLEGNEQNLILDVYNTIQNSAHGHHRRQLGGLDADGDGKLSRVEVLNAMTLHQAIVALDANGDHRFYLQDILDFFGPHSEGLYNQLNTNGDDHLSFGEIQHGTTLGGIFDWFDVDGDGFLEGAEADKVLFIYNEVQNSANGQHRRQLGGLDADGDGKLSRVEVLNAMTLHQAIVALDANGDHRFYLQDILDFFGPHSQGLYNQLNTNGDDHLSFGEIQHGTTLGGIFDWFDVDGDGFLEGTEADKVLFIYNEIQNSAHGQHRRQLALIDQGLDLDGDGLLSKQEVLNAMTLHDAIEALDVDGDNFLYLPQVVELFGDGTFFYQLNHNGDDHLSFGEINHGTSMSAVFDLFDKDGDGFLDSTESDKIYYIWHLMQNPDFGLDADGDGVLSKLEVLSTITLEEAMIAVDTGGDGAFSVEEMMGMFGNDSYALFNRLDTDGDGKLTFEEVKAATSLDRIFDYYDMNGDGLLNGTEADGIWYLYHAIQASPILAHGGLDADGDGVLSFPEVEIVMSLNEALHALDTDNDGGFTLQDTINYFGDEAFFHQLDHNHDGHLSYGEAHHGITLQTIFDHHDKNGDGFLEGHEADELLFIYDAIQNSAARRRRQAGGLDADGDGLLSKPEVLNAISLQQAIDVLDADNDHGFTLQETVDFFGPGSEDLYNRWNTNGDDHLSFGEIHHGTDMGGVFDWFDANADGYLEGPEGDKMWYVYNLIQNHVHGH